MYDTILVPTDGSAAAETATESALGLARQFDAEVRAIHVVDRGELPADVEAEAASELISQGEAALSKIDVAAVDAAWTRQPTSSKRPDRSAGRSSSTRSTTASTRS